MIKKDRPPVEDTEIKKQEIIDDKSKFDCDNMVKHLKEYDLKLLRSMKGSGKTMILWLISKDRTHGYELMTKMNDISPSAEETVSGPSKIYPVLHDLEEAGLIEGTWEAQGKRKIKYYEITDEGIQTLARIKSVFSCHRKTQILEEFWRDMFSKEERGG